LPAVVTGSINTRLGAIAGWGHRTAAGNLAAALPVDYLRAAVFFRSHNRNEHRHLGEAVILTQAKGGLQATDQIAPLREPALTLDEYRAMLARLIFPPPPQDVVHRIIHTAVGGIPWTQRIADLSKLARPDRLASIVTAGYFAGKNQQQIARDLLPVMDGVRSSAKRVARTEGLRVAHALQMEANAQIDDLIIGYQIRGTMDQNIRPHHALRNGRIWRKDSGQPMEKVLMMSMATLPDEPN
jgi:SPP1 gp7 family putative phage head morphogenesis protein